jgi:hypothetical protein
LQKSIEVEVTLILAGSPCPSTKNAVEVSIECRRTSRQTPVKRLFSQIYFVLPPRVEGIVRGTVKIFEQAKYIKSGEIVLDRGTQFIIKEVRVDTNDGKIVFIDMEGVGHGVYHPDEYLGIGEELAFRLYPGYTAAVDSGSRLVISRAHDSPRDRAKDGRVSAGIPRHSRPGNPRRDF